MYQPVIPTNGLGGWRFLQKTYESQFDSFSNSLELKRDSDYFREHVGEIRSAEEFVNDRRLMTVALTAFGLQDDLNNKFFIRKVLEEGSKNDDALANRFADPRYKELSKALGFGPTEFPQVRSIDFVEKTISRFESSRFEIAAGEQNPSMRLALYAERKIPSLANLNASNDAKWFSIMGDPPLRQVFETALNLPSSLGQIDLDQQLSIFKERSAKVFGTDKISDFGGAELINDLTTKFVVRDQINDFNSNVSSGSIALTLLRGY